MVIRLALTIIGLMACLLTKSVYIEIHAHSNRHTEAWIARLTNLFTYEQTVLKSYLARAALYAVVAAPLHDSSQCSQSKMVPEFRLMVHTKKLKQYVNSHYVGVDIMILMIIFIFVTCNSFSHLESHYAKLKCQLSGNSEYLSYRYF